MTSLYSAYTPLESLLLFQALRSEGVHAISFNHISEQLKSIPLVQHDPTYDSGRLSPDALRELYLGLLKDEAKRDLEQQSLGDTQNAPVNGDISRKRKAPSPSLPTVHEAAQHSHLIPQLVSRLYARYRENVVRSLRENERKYGLITRDLDEIQAGKWDERLQRLRAAPARQSPKPSSTAHTQPIVTQPEQTQSLSANSTHVVTTTESNPSQPKVSPQVRLDAINIHRSDRTRSPGSRQIASPNVTLPPTSNITPDPSRTNVSKQTQPPGDDRLHEPPQSPEKASQPAASVHDQVPSARHQSPYPQQQTAPSRHASNVSSPHSKPAISRPSSPKRTDLSPPPLLPAEINVQIQPTQQGTSTGTQTSNTLPDHPSPSQSQVQAPQPSMNGDRHHARIQSQMPSVPVPSVHQQQQQQQSQPRLQPQTPYAEPRPPYQHAPLASNFSAQPAHPSGHILASSQVNSQESTKLPHETPRQRQPLSSGLDRRLPLHMPHPHDAPATAPRLHPQAPSPMLSSILRGLATPPRLKTRPLWKSEHRPPYINVSTEPTRPEVEPDSPTHERLRSPARSTRSIRSRDPRATEDSFQQAPPTKPRLYRRRNNARAGSPHSVASSVGEQLPRARTRSQSVSTAAGAPAALDDHPGGGTGVKAEPSTPANLMEDPESTPAPAATPASGPRTRKRKGTLQAQTLPPSKRRLQDSPSNLENDQDTLSSPPRRSSTVLAAKNFGKMCTAVMNDINSHKHASYFATAVRDKDAPGYSEIVYQPQNLKSIRTAITAGTRVVSAAASTLDSPTGTPAASISKVFEGSSAIELERTVDLIPPKAIVNGAQLEKELMRMFANAFMFNPGEDGMALITKEIFQDVEQTLNDWRGTEREAGGEEDDEGKGKRRKL